MADHELNFQDVDIILKEHNKYFDTQITKELNFRREKLEKLKAGIKKYEKEIVIALNEDLGKSEFESYETEIGFVYHSISETIKNLKKWIKPQRVSTPIYLMPARSYIIKEPYGTVLIIGPYNYPFHLCIEPLVGVIATGNCAVLKPSELAPSTSAVVKKMIEDTFEKEYIRCVEGSVETNTSLINAKFDYIFFTGSVSVGKIVMEAAAKNLVPVTLELGGKSPVIIDESANIKEAAERIIWGKTLNVGQTCVAPDYVLAHESVKDELIEEMKESIKKYFGSDIRKSDCYGRIINERHLQRIIEIMGKDKEGIVYGGNFNIEDKFIKPTIIEISSWNAASMQEEIFGPVLPIMSYKNLNDAVKEIKKRPKPLALYMFTKSKKTEEILLKEISSGSVCINDTMQQISNSTLPFGGVGNSGIGSYHGKQSIITFSHQKSVLKKHNRIKFNIMYPPYDLRKLGWIKRFLK